MNKQKKKEIVYKAGDAIRTQMLKEAGLTFEQYRKACVSVEEFIKLMVITNPTPPPEKKKEEWEFTKQQLGKIFDDIGLDLSDEFLSHLSTLINDKINHELSHQRQEIREMLLKYKCGEHKKLLSLLQEK